MNGKLYFHPNISNYVLNYQHQGTTRQETFRYTRPEFASSLMRLKEEKFRIQIKSICRFLWLNFLEHIIYEYESYDCY